MLRNALPAEKSTALGTSGHRFAELMMVTTLMCQILHRVSILSSGLFQREQSRNTENKSAANRKNIKTQYERIFPG